MIRLRRRGPIAIAIAIVFTTAVTAPAVVASDGAAALFEEKCSGCHQADGSGVEGLYPPLVGLSAWLSAPAGRDYVAQVLTHGLFGAIEVGGVTYNGGLMPGFAHLSTTELVALLNYLGGTLNEPTKGYMPFDDAAVEAARQSKLSGPALKAVRDKLHKR